MAALTQRKLIGIVGAGIAGPLLALQILSHPCLSSLYRPIIFDREPDPTAELHAATVAPHQRQQRQRPSAAAAVGIFANGLYPLHKLGLREPLEEISYEMWSIKFWDGKGKFLKGCDNPAWSPHLQANCRSVERGRLQRLLLEEVVRRDGEVRWDKARTRITFTDGTSETADLLIGADGAFSSVRRHLLRLRDPATAEERWLPDYMRQTGFYGVSSGFPLPPEGSCDAETLATSKATNAVWLERGILSSAPLSDGKMRWDLIMPETEPPAWPPADQPRSTADGSGARAKWEAALLPSAYTHQSSVELLNRYRQLSHPVSGSLSHLLEGAERIVCSPLRQRVWAEDEIQCGNVVLIGDAARLMLPSSGQGIKLSYSILAGTSFGIEDATVLARCLLKHAQSGSPHHKGLGQAFEEYATERVPRSRKMASVAYWAGELSLASSWYMRWLRSLSTAYLPVGQDLKSNPNAKDPWPSNSWFDVE